MRLFSAVLGLSLALSAFGDKLPPPQSAVDKLLKLPGIAPALEQAAPEKKEIPILDKFTEKEKKRFISLLGEYAFFGESFGEVETHLADLQKNYIDPAKADEVTKKNEKLLERFEKPLREIVGHLSLMLKPRLEEIGMKPTSYAQSLLEPKSFEIKFYEDKKAFEAKDKPRGEVAIRVTRGEAGMMVEIRAEIDGKDVEAGEEK